MSSLRESWRKIEKRKITEKQTKTSQVNWMARGPLQSCNWTKQAVWPAVFLEDNKPAKSGELVQQCPAMRKGGSLPSQCKETE